MIFLQIVELAVFIWLFVYLLEKVHSEYECFKQCSRDIIAVQDIFTLLRFSFDDDYNLVFTKNVSEKREDAVFVLMYHLSKCNVLVQKETKSFVPEFYRIKFLIEMGAILNNAKVLLTDYEYADSIWRFIFRKSYDELKAIVPDFEKQYEMLCSNAMDDVFCTPIDLK